jgi:hypothetical protein
MVLEENPVSTPSAFMLQPQQNPQRVLTPISEPYSTRLADLEILQYSGSRRNLWKDIKGLISRFSFICIYIYASMLLSNKGEFQINLLKVFFIC